MKALAAILAASFIPFTTQAVTFHTDSSTFDMQVSALGMTQIGVTEDWESSILPLNTLDDFMGPIEYGVPASEYFPNGTAIPGMTVQDNTDRSGMTATPTDPAGPYPRGLATAQPTIAATPNSQISSAGPGDGFDMIFDPPVDALSFVPLFFSAWFFFDEYRGPGSLMVMVFDENNVHLGSIVLDGYDYTEPAINDQYLGITDASIGRVAIVTGMGSIEWYGQTYYFAGNYSGADDIKAYVD